MATEKRKTENTTTGAKDELAQAAARPAAQAAAVRPGLGRSNPQSAEQFALLDFATFFSLTAIGEMGFEELHLPLQHAPNFWIRGGCGLQNLIKYRWIGDHHVRPPNVRAEP